MLLLGALPHERLLHVPRLLRGSGAEPGALGPVQLALLALRSHITGVCCLAVLLVTNTTSSTLHVIIIYFK